MGPFLTLYSKKTGQTQAFYTALGVDLLEERHGNGPLHVAAELGILALEVFDAAESGLGEFETVLGLPVADLDAACARLEGLGAPKIREVGLAAGKRRAVYRDPDGRAVYLFESPDREIRSLSASNLEK